MEKQGGFVILLLQFLQQYIVIISPFALIIRNIEYYLNKI